MKRTTRSRAVARTRTRSVRTRAVPQDDGIVRGKDGKPIKVCPACTPADDGPGHDHRHWLFATPGARHLPDCPKEATS